ncbi:hypothetical protein PENTCL1PPCAC_15903 [Pristionchus entomophagus]|uniref:G protein-coupled receptor n=1 Tax=Pristionchus entomophagus TaxID=358040 RepID=A0AAV5THI6_9BILA|nr:hypothetical protein PENTCL1PPCAC_15903 [Pristionchus entomophagus]
MVYLQLRVNRSSTDEMYPFFEIVYTIESLFTLLFYALAPLTFFMLWNAKPLHRNLRLSLCNMILQGLFGSMARLILLYNLYTGTDHLGNNHPINVFFQLENMIQFKHSLFLAIERIIATFAWCW